MHDGTTPLILAARLAIEGMVEDLIHADADINIPDNSGKTALHWAASVNNVDAVNILLANNANKDAQDDKVTIYYFDFRMQPAVNTFRVDSQRTEINNICVNYTFFYVMYLG